MCYFSVLKCFHLFPWKLNKEGCESVNKLIIILFFALGGETREREVTSICKDVQPGGPATAGRPVFITLPVSFSTVGDPEL